MTLPRPIAKRGPVAARREPWLARSRRILVARSGGKCEGECGRRAIPLDPAHIFGRGNKGLGEPWASCPELMAALCRDEHNDIDQGTQPDQVELREHIRWTAFWRLTSRLRLGDETRRWDSGDRNALDATRALVRYCDEHGITHPDSVSLPGQEENP